MATENKYYSNNNLIGILEWNKFINNRAQRSEDYDRDKEARYSKNYFADWQEYDDVKDEIFDDYYEDKPLQYRPHGDHDCHHLDCNHKDDCDSHDWNHHDCDSYDWNHYDPDSYDWNHRDCKHHDSDRHDCKHGCEHGCKQHCCKRHNCKHMKPRICRAMGVTGATGATGATAPVI